MKHKIICGNCIEVMKDMYKKEVDLILTDPPYGLEIAKNGKIGGNGKITVVTEYTPVKWDNLPLSKEQTNEIFRISKNQILFGYNYISNLLPSSRCVIVWDKKCQNNWDDNFSDCELAWTSFNKPSKVFRYLWMGALRKGENRKNERVHPTQKPLKLMEYILEHFSKEKNIILDPFLGSGTTMVAAERLGRNSIGIEISKEYCELSYQRLLKEVEQQKWNQELSTIEKIGF